VKVSQKLGLKTEKLQRCRIYAEHLDVKTPKSVYMWNLYPKTNLTKCSPETEPALPSSGHKNSPNTTYDSSAEPH